MGHSQFPLALRSGQPLGCPCSPLAPRLPTVACSRAVNAGSCPTSPRHATAARPANTPHDAGDVGMPSTLQSHHPRQATPSRPVPTLSQPWHSNRRLVPEPSCLRHPRRRASHSRGRGGATPHFRHRRPPSPPAARASAQTKFRKNPGPALRPPRLLRPLPPLRRAPLSNISVPAAAARRYDASDSGKHDSGSDADCGGRPLRRRHRGPPALAPFMSSHIEKPRR